LATLTQISQFLVAADERTAEDGSNDHEAFTVRRVRFLPWTTTGQVRPLARVSSPGARTAAYQARQN